MPPFFNKQKEQMHQQKQQQQLRNQLPPAPRAGFPNTANPGSRFFTSQTSTSTPPGPSFSSSSNAGFGGGPRTKAFNFCRKEPDEPHPGTPSTTSTSPEDESKRRLSMSTPSPVGGETPMGACRQSSDQRSSPPGSTEDEYSSHDAEACGHDNEGHVGKQAPPYDDCSEVYGEGSAAMYDDESHQYHLHHSQSESCSSDISPPHYEHHAEPTAFSPDAEMGPSYHLASPHQETKRSNGNETMEAGKADTQGDCREGGASISGDARPAIPAVRAPSEHGRRGAGAGSAPTSAVLEPAAAAAPLQPVNPQLQPVPKKAVPKQRSSQAKEQAPRRQPPPPRNQLQPPPQSHEELLRQQKIHQQQTIQRQHHEKQQQREKQLHQQQHQQQLLQQQQRQQQLLQYQQHQQHQRQQLPPRQQSKAQSRPQQKRPHQQRKQALDAAMQLTSAVTSQQLATSASAPLAGSPSAPKQVRCEVKKDFVAEARKMNAELKSFKDQMVDLERGGIATLVAVTKHHATTLERMAMLQFEADELRALELLAEKLESFVENDFVRAEFALLGEAEYVVEDDAETEVDKEDKNTVGEDLEDASVDEMARGSAGGGGECSGGSECALSSGGEASPDKSSQSSADLSPMSDDPPSSEDSPSMQLSSPSSSESQRSDYTEANPLLTSPESPCNYDDETNSTLTNQALLMSPEKEDPVTLSSPDLSEGLGSNSFPETPDYAMLGEDTQPLFDPVEAPPSPEATQLAQRCIIEHSVSPESNSSPMLSGDDTLPLSMPASLEVDRSSSSQETREFAPGTQALQRDMIDVAAAASALADPQFPQFPEGLAQSSSPGFAPNGSTITTEEAPLQTIVAEDTSLLQIDQYGEQLGAPASPTPSDEHSVSNKGNDCEKNPGALYTLADAAAGAAPHDPSEYSECTSVVPTTSPTTATTIQPTSAPTCAPQALTEVHDISVKGISDVNKFPDSEPSSLLHSDPSEHFEYKPHTESPLHTNNSSQERQRDGGANLSPLTQQKELHYD